MDRNPPFFEAILMDIDGLFKVKRVYNALDIVNEMLHINATLFPTLKNKQNKYFCNEI